jgi:hypothetical protein
MSLNIHHFVEISCRLENAQTLVKIDKINVSTYMVALLLKVGLEAPVFTSLTVEFCSMCGIRHKCSHDCKQEQGCGDECGSV